MPKPTVTIVYDTTHFCPSWCICCEANLKLKPKKAKK